MLPRHRHHLVSLLATEIWAITPDRLAEIMVQALYGDQEAKVTKTQEREVARREGMVAVLPLHDTITNRSSIFDIFGGTSSELFGKVFMQAVANPDVKAIVLDVNSPGGTVSGTDELASVIYAARGVKPIVAHVNSMAASAAYWISSAADEMVMTPTGMAGSIGVIAAHDDVSGLLANAGVKRTLISSSKYKAEGNPFEPLSEEARDNIQDRVDGAHRMFVKAVARNRGASQKTVEEDFGQGRMMDAEKAVSLGMADGIGTLGDVLARFGAVSTKAATSRRAFAFEREKRALKLG